MAIQIAEIIELNKDIGHGCIGSRQRDELSADSIGVSLVGLPNIQQAVVRMEQRIRERFPEVGRIFIETRRVGDSKA